MIDLPDSVISLMLVCPPFLSPQIDPSHRLASKTEQEIKPNLAVFLVLWTGHTIYNLF